MRRPPPRTRSSLLALSLLLGLLALAPGASAAVPARLARQADAIAGRYIVVLRGDATRSLAASSVALARGYGGRVTWVFGAALDGYVAEMSEAQALRLSRDPRVAYVEEDARLHVDGTQSPADWGLDRLDQHALPLDNSYTYATDGTSVTAYVIDTGILFTHVEFGGRAVSGIDTVDGGSADDCAGHGTHVAGTIGGSTYGVAQNVGLVAVRVLNCQGSGSTSGVIAGIDWVTADHSPGELAVANMSLGGARSRSLDRAVKASIADGVTYSISAGNGDANNNPVDACEVSPARVPAALTVSATNSSDSRVTWANIGTCVDIFAPGYGITSATNSSPTDTRVLNGTSMAAPHVTGVAALYLDANPSATPSSIATAILTGATQNVVTSPGNGSPNRLLFSGVAGTPPPPPPPGAISLSVVGKSGRRGNVAKLTWSGATSGTVDVYRDSALVMTTANDGAKGDKLGSATGTLVYQVCEAGTITCSNTASVNF